MLKKLTSKQLTPQENKLPSKEERKQAKKEQEAINQNFIEIKALLEEFVANQILPLNAPVDVVEQIPDLLKSLINIYKTKSVEWNEFLEAKKKLSEVKFCDLTEKDEA